MNLEENIKNNTIIICENSYKQNILKYLNEKHLFLNVKFFTMPKFIEEYLFTYKDEALYYLIKKYNYKVDVAKMYLDNLIFIEEKEYKNSKLNFLVNLRKELLANDLLLFNKDFAKYIQNYQIIVVGYPFIQKYERNILNNLNAKFINDKENYPVKYVYEFNTLEDEINFVCKDIAKLINEGTPVNAIKLAGITKEYYNDLNRIFEFYQIPLKIPTSNNLYNNEITKIFLNSLEQGVTYAYEMIKDEDSSIVMKIVNIYNKYNYIQEIDILKKILVYEFKKTKIDNFKLKNYIEIVDIFDDITDCYVYFLGFNAGYVPNSFKDESYITDSIKEEVNLSLVVDANKEYQSKLIARLKSIKNLTLSYKLKDNTKEYYPSFLVDDLNLEIKHYEDDLKISYSLLLDKITLAKEEFDYHKYGIITDSYLIHKNNLPSLGYNTFDNKFKGINNESLKEYLNKSLTLSYTSLNNYNKCAFKYYITNILKLDKYEETFESFIGSIFHDVLEKCLKSKSNVEEEVKNYLEKKNKVLNSKETFFLNNIIEDIKFVVDAINKQQEYIGLEKYFCEKNFRIIKNKDINVQFVGFVDKLLYKEENDETLVAIIDYKTGEVETNIKYAALGLNLQLPIYLYLVKNSHIFKNPKIVGFYIQKVLNKNILAIPNVSYNEQRLDTLKLIGYTNRDIHSLALFDSTYENSKLIKGLKIKNDGDFYTTAKVLSDKEIDNLVKITEEIIDKSIDNILKGEFPINPKKIGFDKEIGCAFCKFKDLCFKKEKDYVIYDDVTDLNFLGGNIDA